jgi:hypothetical protein
MEVAFISKPSVNMCQYTASQPTKSQPHTEVPPATNCTNINRDENIYRGNLVGSVIQVT